MIGRVGRLGLLVAVVSITGGTAAAGRGKTAVTVAREPPADFVGDTGGAIQKAVDRVHDAGGGVVRIRPGVYRLDRALDLSDRQRVTIIGEGRVILRMGAQQSATIAVAATGGAERLRLDRPLGPVSPARLEIQCPSWQVTAPDGHVFTVKYHSAEVDHVSGETVFLKRPLAYPAPAGTTVLVVSNAVVVRRNARDITLENLIIDMNRGQRPIAPKNHTTGCGILAQASFSYEKGPTAPPIEGLRVIRCTIRNGHQRGVAFYNVVHSGVYDCRIENTAAEGIDFDHFVYHCEAVGNVLTDCRNIELNDASRCLISGNRIVRPREGVRVWQWCKLPGLNERNLIVGNEIIEAKGDGITLRSGADENIVAGNVIRDAGGTGIVVEGRRNVLDHNTVSGCGRRTVRITGAETIRLDGNDGIRKNGKGMEK